MTEPERPSLADRLHRLAGQLEAFESPEFSFGEWVPSWTDADGVIHLGWYRLSPGAEAFLADVARGGWVEPFDWPAWLSTPEGRTLAGDPAAVSHASPDDIGHLLTACIRQDRFAEGSLAGAYESGLLTAIMRRAQVLAAEMRQDSGEGA